MTIHKFINPKTSAYKTFKEHVLSIQFSWYHYKNISPDMFNIGGDKYTNIDAYHHSFLARPGPPKPFPFVNTSPEEMDLVEHVLKEIFRSNHITLNCLYRISANCTLPIKEDKGAFPHIDHNFPHKNLIIYLTDPAGGDTVLVDKDYKEIDRHHPKEDDIISFEGIHYQKMPKEGRRIVLVVTYI